MAGEELVELEGGETIARIYYVRGKSLFSLNEEKKKYFPSQCDSIEYLS